MPAPYPIRDPAAELIDYLDRRIAFAQLAPLWLGGGSGSPGSAAPPGGYVGMLPQNRVQYDSVEAEYSSGGSTLMDNLAHDRFRLTEYIEQLASYSLGGGQIGNVGTVDAGDVPSWGSGAFLVAFGPGSPPGMTTVQDAIQYVWNNRLSGIASYYTWHIIAFTFDGDLDAETGKLEIELPGPGTITSVKARLGTAPTGADVIFDINKNGSSILDGSKLTVTAGQKVATATPADTAIVAGDYFTCDVDQRGSTIPGANAAVHIFYKQLIQV